MIEGESQRLARLVDDLLDLSRIEAGAVDPRTDWCDLSDVVCERRGAGARRAASIRSSSSCPADLPLVQADAAQLERVFANLIENAIKFSPDGVPVRISGGVGGGARDGARDRPGPRHPAEPAGARVRAVLPRATIPAGSGLGLAICRGFVEANGGRIQLQTGTPDGTSFAVSFPLVPQPARVHVSRARVSWSSTTSPRSCAA